MGYLVTGFNVRGLGGIAWAHENGGEWAVAIGGGGTVWIVWHIVEEVERWRTGNITIFLFVFL